MTEDERPNAPQDEGAAPEEAEGTPSAEPGESPDAEGGTEEQQPADPAAEAESEEPASGDEDLSTTEDEAEEVTDAPETEAREREGRERRRRGGKSKDGEKEVIPGEHLAPDLVLEEERAAGGVDELATRFAADAVEAEAQPEAVPAPATEEEPEAPSGEPAERPEPRSVLDLAADARYQATGKRKSSIARVILRPGDGAYSVNGRSLEDYFPRAALQNAARQPLATAGFEKRMDVIARIHGGGVASQAGALRHGVARALVEADPSLRVELKRRGFLSRDARVKERKKAGLKKARKRPQFSKR
ncbi:MAG: 30S ribosomal protein S9 [Actinobacteria bacterium]|nr:MAG: 30S ribosomal protein S9 [Actinomycetota bacterium]